MSSLKNIRKKDETSYSKKSGYYNTVYNDEEFSAYADRIDGAFDAWCTQVDPGLRSIDEDVNVKKYIVELSEQLIAAFDGSAGGTRYTMEYAMRQKLGIIDLPILQK